MTFEHARHTILCGAVAVYSSNPIIHIQRENATELYSGVLSAVNQDQHQYGQDENSVCVLFPNMLGNSALFKLLYFSVQDD